MKSTQQIPFINSRQHSAHRDALKAEDRCPCATQQSSFPIVALWQRLLLLKLRPRLGMLHQVLHRLRGEKPNSRFSQPSGCHITTSENDSPGSKNAIRSIGPQPERLCAVLSQEGQGSSVRNDGRDHGNIGIIRSPHRAKTPSDCSRCLPDSQRVGSPLPSLLNTMG
jgi:hypothetical protein